MDLAKYWNYATELVANFLKLALPYWLIRELDHIKLMTFFVVCSLIVLGVTTVAAVSDGSSAYETSVQFGKIGIVLVGFAMAGSYFIHGFIPNPANNHSIQELPPRTPSELIKDLASVLLFVNFFSLLSWQLLNAIGIFSLFNFRNWQWLDQFVRSHDLVMVEPFFQALLSTLFVIVLMLMRDKAINTKGDPLIWGKSLTLRALGPYCSVLVLICSISTAAINELI